MYVEFPFQISAYGVITLVYEAHTLILTVVNTFRHGALSGGLTSQPVDRERWRAGDELVDLLCGRLLMRAGRYAHTFRPSDLLGDVRVAPEQHAAEVLLLRNLWRELVDVGDAPARYTEL